MKGFKLRNIVALFIMVLIGASVLVAHVWKQNSYVRLSKESIRLTRDHKALRDSIALLELESGELRKLARIEGLAKDRFGLEYGISAVPVYPEAGGEGHDGVLARGGRTARGGEGRELESGRAAWPTRGL